MDKGTLLEIQDSIRTIPDYPRPGVQFRDITTLLGNARTFRRVIDELVEPWSVAKVDRVAGIEARGFILGGAVAHQLAAGFVPIRKKGKLPHSTVRVAYSLEYGIDEMEMHEDAVSRGERLILVDDLIATGGTAEAAVKLLRQLGAEILGCMLCHRSARAGWLEKTHRPGRAGANSRLLRRSLSFPSSVFCKLARFFRTTQPLFGELRCLNALSPCSA